MQFDVYKCELLGDGFLYTSPTERPRPKPQALASRGTADREAVRKEAAARLGRLFARRRVEEFVDALLGARPEASMSEVPVEVDEDYVRLLYLASYGLDGGSSFRLRPSAERLFKGRYGHPAGRIERTRRRRRGEPDPAPSAARS